MDELTEGAMRDARSPMPGPTGDGPGRAGRRRRPLGARAGAVVVIAGGLAAGSYGVAAATSRSGPSASVVSLSASKKQANLPPGHLGVPGDHRGVPGGPRGGFGEGHPGGLAGMGMGPGGTVTAVTPRSITVSTAAGPDVTVATDSSTVYREGGSRVARSAVKSGGRVAFVPAAGPEGGPWRLSGSAAASTERLVREVDILQPQIAGKVVKIAGAQLTVADAQGFWRTVNVSASTSYFEQGATARAADVHVGTELVVTGTIAPNHTQLDATSVEILLPVVGGSVTGVSGTTITLQSFDGATEKVTTDSSTVFRSASGTTTISAVKTGSVVVAFGTPGSGNTFAAVRVLVGPDGTGPDDPPPTAGGTGPPMAGGTGPSVNDRAAGLAAVA